MPPRTKFKREEDIVYRLEQENRELKAINRSLLKRLKKVSKGYYKFLAEEDEDDREEAMQEVTKEIKKICFDCSIGEMQEVIILNRRWRQCTKCSRRTKTKVVNE